MGTECSGSAFKGVRSSGRSGIGNARALEARRVARKQRTAPTKVIAKAPMSDIATIAIIYLNRAFDAQFLGDHGSVKPMELDTLFTNQCSFRMAVLDTIFSTAFNFMIRFDKKACVLTRAPNWIFKDFFIEFIFPEYVQMLLNINCN